MKVKIVNSSDPYIFEQNLQSLINEYEPQYNLNIQYQNTSFIYNNYIRYTWLLKYSFYS